MECGLIEVDVVVNPCKGAGNWGGEKVAALSFWRWEKVIKRFDVRPLEGLVGDGVGVGVRGGLGTQELETLIAKKVQ